MVAAERSAALFSVLTLPNLLTFSRFGLVLAMLLLSWYERGVGFLCCLAACIILDFGDGFLARRLNLTSELGTLLDSFADLAMFSSLPVCALLLWPEIVRREAPFVTVALVSYALPIGLGLLKYRRLTAYHTWGGKISVGLMAGTPLILFTNGPGWPFRLATIIFAVVELEEIAITILLPAWRANVPSLWHAWKIKSALAIKT